MGATDKKENSPMLSKIPLGTKFNEEHSSHEQPPGPGLRSVLAGHLDFSIDGLPPSCISLLRP